MAKHAETTYRDVNIGLANQFARFALDNNIDIYTVIEACNTQPYSHIHHPGIAVGGHCIPIYPQMYLWNDPSATIVRAAREANWAMPAHSVQLLERVHGRLDGQRVGVFGVSYRGAVKESAFSGVFPLVDELKNRHASVLVHDPMYSTDEILALGFTPFENESTLDAVIIQADHPEYSTFNATDFGSPRTMLNGRNMDLTAEIPVVVSLGRPLPTRL
jgi:nucleotide sugar dehydrogenase